MARPVGPVLAVCGLSAEARIAHASGIRTVTGAGRSDRLAISIEQEIRRGAAAVISFGVAGALTADLAPGTLIVATEIVDGPARYPTDTTWSEALVHRLPHARRAAIAGSEVVVSYTPAKHALFRATGAGIVDMESHVAARIAARCGLPFVALRAVADPAGRDLPPAALIAMAANGGIDLPAILASIARKPFQLAMLLRIGLDARMALRSLRHARLLLGAGLGYADFDQLPLDVVGEDVVGLPLA